MGFHENTSLKVIKNIIKNSCHTHSHLRGGGIHPIELNHIKYREARYEVE